jgi:hypothetical protein
MVWSNWQGAIWRGAGVMLLFWSGLAWTQTPAPRSASELAEPTMVVHENGKSTRCRVLETWKLPDGRKAHLLEAIDSGEKITIVTEPTAPANPRAMPIRIFSWGQGHQAPPDGSPLPPHLRIDSGVVIKNQAPLPAGAVVRESQDPAIINRADDTPLGGSFAGPGPRTIEHGPAHPMSPGLLARLFPAKTGAFQKPDEPQILDFPAGQAGQAPAPPTNPLIQAQAPAASGANAVVQADRPIGPDKGVVQAKGSDGTPGSKPLLQTQGISGTPGGNPLLQTQGISGTPGNPLAQAQGVGATPGSGLVQAKGTGDTPGNPLVQTQGTVGPLIVNGQGNGNNTNPVPGIVPGTPIPPAPGIVPGTPLPPSLRPPLPPIPGTVIGTPPAPGIVPGTLLPPAPGVVPGTPLPPAPGVVSGTPLPPTPGVVPGTPLPPTPGIVPGTPLPPPAPGLAPSIPTPLPTPVNTPPQPNSLQPAPSAGNPLSPSPGVLPPAKSGADSAPSIPSPVADPTKPPVEAKKTWRPGERIAGWWQNKAAKPETKPEVPPAPVVVNPQVAKADDKNLPPIKDDDKLKKDDTNLKKADEFLNQQNKLADKKLTEKVEKIYKGAFSTAMNPTAPEMKKPEPTPLAIPAAPTPPKEEKAALAPPPPPVAKEEIKPANGSDQEKRDMFGMGASQATTPGRSVLDTPGLVKLPPPPVPRRDDPLMAPERFSTPVKANVLPPVARETKPESLPDRVPTPAKANVLPVAREIRPAPAPAPVPDMSARNPWPLGAQSVLAARSGLEGPIAYVPVPTVTVPQPNRPPVPPAPALPDAPQLNAYVNAFSAPPAPKGAPQMPQQGMMPQQAMMPYGNPMMPYGNPMMQPMQPYGYGYPQAPAYTMSPYGPQGPMMNPMMAQQMPYRQPMMVSQGPTANYGRQYMGPMPPQNPFAPPVMPAGYGYPPMMPQQQMMPQQPMMPQQSMVQPVAYQQMMQTPAAQTQQVEQLIRVMRENAYPAQREWAAQMLASYEWRMHPQIVPALLQSAAQDPAATVRAGCVTCLGRMQAAVEPVFGTLHAMRGDIDPRVRTAVEQAFVQLGQTPMAPQ